MGFVRAVVAWLAAVAAASVALVLSFMAFEAGGQSVGIDDVRGAAAVSLFVAAFMASITALPWAGLVWLGRWTRAPRGLWDAGAGAVMGPALFLLVFQRPLVSETLGVAAVFGFAGAVGGLVYWAVAGRPRRRATPRDLAAAFE